VCTHPLSSFDASQHRIVQSRCSMFRGGIAGLMFTLAAMPAIAAPPQDEIIGDGFDGFELSLCDSGLASNSTAPADFASALDLCQTTTESAHSPGLISATLTLADGAGTPAVPSHAIRTSFGANNAPRNGAAMVVLSTGAAAATGQTNPAFVAFQNGADNAKLSDPPADCTRPIARSFRHCQFVRPRPGAKHWTRSC